MSHSGKNPTNISDVGFDNLSVKDSFTCEANKPDFRELDLGSPVSPLRNRPSGLTATTTTTSSSSSSSGSVSGQTRPNSLPRRPESSPNSHSGELSDTSPAPSTRNFKPGHNRSDSGSTHPGIYSGHHQSSVNSPPPVNVFPTGNICPSGRILKTGMGFASNRSSRTDTLGSGSGHYGHGSIIRGGGGGGINAGGAAPSLRSSSGVFPENAQANKSRGGGGGGGGDAEEVKRLGNELYRKGCFGEALSMYDRAIALAPANAAYRANRAAALTGLGRVVEAVKDCEEAVRLDPSYWRAHQRLASLLIRLGQVEKARRHLCLPGQQPDPSELQKLQGIERHLSKCTDARKASDWKSALREADATIAAGADFSPQLFMCREEALLKLHQLEDVESSLSNVPKVDLSTISCSNTRFFGMLAEAYPFFVRAQIEMALGRFENAVTAAEKAAQIDPRNVEAIELLKNVRLVARARTRGNDLFKSERYTEACSMYGEGLGVDPSNAILYCNRAACWFKLGLCERSIDDCNQALSIQPNYTKALRRRAASNSKLERWADAVRDYEVLRRDFPDDNEVAESLFHAQVALKKSRGEEVHNMKFGGEVEEVSGPEQFRAAVSLPGISIVYFKAASNSQCKQISPFVDTLCGRYPSINFLKVDIGESPAVANAESVRIVPTFKIYKDGTRVKEIVCPSRDMLEHSVRHYSI